MPNETALAQSGAQGSLSDRFKIPASFWAPIALEASSFLGTQDDRAENGDLTSYGELCHYLCYEAETEREDTFFRFLIKEAREETWANPPINGLPEVSLGYEWHRLGVFTTWLPANVAVILCFDFPSSVKDALSSSILKSTISLRLDDPFAVHVVLIEKLVALYDKALWSCRNLVRDMEKVRVEPSKPERLR